MRDEGSGRDRDRGQGMGILKNNFFVDALNPGLATGPSQHLAKSGKTGGDVLSHTPWDNFRPGQNGG